MYTYWLGSANDTMILCTNPLPEVSIPGHRAILSTCGCGAGGTCRVVTARVMNALVSASLPFNHQEAPKPAWAEEASDTRAVRKVMGRVMVVSGKWYTREMKEAMFKSMERKE